jgi:hypothetical protein
MHAACVYASACLRHTHPRPPPSITHAAYAPGGSFGRTALKAELGAKTPLANVYTALFVTVVLVGFTQ